MSSADFIIYTPGIGTVYYAISSGDNSAHFLQLIPFTIFPVFVPPGTHHCWVDKCGMVWEVLPNTSTRALTTVIWWERINLPCAAICVRQTASLYPKVLHCQLGSVVRSTSIDATRQRYTIYIYALGMALRHEQHSPAMGVRCLDHSTTTADTVNLQVTPTRSKQWKQKESAYDCCCIRRQTRRRFNQWIINNILLHIITYYYGCQSTMNVSKTTGILLSHMLHYALAW